MITGILNRRDQNQADGIIEYVGRPTILGNPFSHKHGTLAKHYCKSRDEAVESYHQWLRGQWRTNPAVRTELIRLATLAKLGDLYLSCWCAPQRCHADVIKRAIEGIIRAGLV